MVSVPGAMWPGQRTHSGVRIDGSYGHELLECRPCSPHMQPVVGGEDHQGVREDPAGRTAAAWSRRTGRRRVMIARRWLSHMPLVLLRGVALVAHVRRLVGPVRLRHAGAAADGRDRGVLRLRDGQLRRWCRRGWSRRPSAAPAASRRGRNGLPWLTRLRDVLAAAHAQVRWWSSRPLLRETPSTFAWRRRRSLPTSPWSVVEARRQAGLGPGGEELAVDVGRVARALQVAGDRVRQ